MIRSAAYTLSPNSILCIPSLEGWKWKIQIQKTLQSNQCDPMAIQSLHPFCGALQSGTHSMSPIHFFHTVNVQSCRACDPFLRGTATRPYRSVFWPNWSRGRKTLPRASRTLHSAERRQSALLARTHAFDICKQVLFSSFSLVFSVLRRILS